MLERYLRWYVECRSGLDGLPWYGLRGTYYCTLTCETTVCGNRDMEITLAGRDCRYLNGPGDLFVLLRVGLSSCLPV